MNDLLSSDLFRNAVLGGSIAALVTAATGFFMSLRALAFLSEALTDISFAGATGGALLGGNPLLGMVAFTVLTVFGLGSLNERLRGRDVETGMLLSFALGLGVLFLSLYAHSSAQHVSWGVGILFGSITSMKAGDLVVASILGVAALSVLGVLFRPLLFTSLDPVLAKSRGVPTRWVSTAFLVVLALSTSIAVMVVGVLLTGALMIAPATAALNIFRSPFRSLVFSAVFGLGVVWAGIFLGFFLPYHLPVSFYIATLASLLYFVSVIVRRRRKARVVETEPHQHTEREIRG